MGNRRDFLRSCAVGVGALAGAPENVLERILAAGRDTADLTPNRSRPTRTSGSKSSRPSPKTGTIINLNNGTVQNGLRIVQDAVRRHSDFSGNAAWHSMAILEKEIESCRRRLASHLGCDPEELVICRGGTEAGQIPIMGLDLKRGDEVVITNQDYPRLLSPWKQREKREGIVLKIVPLPAPPVPLDQFYRLVEQQVTPRTKVIHVCHMTHWTGQMAPIRRISDMAHAKGIEVLVDGAHGFMHVPFKLADFGCDYYTASLHKWLMAPPGNGFVRIPKDRIPKVWPLTPPWTDDTQRHPPLRRCRDAHPGQPHCHRRGHHLQRGHRHRAEIGAHPVPQRALGQPASRRCPRCASTRAWTPPSPAASPPSAIEGMDMAKLTEPSARQVGDHRLADEAPGRTDRRNPDRGERVAVGEGNRYLRRRHGGHYQEGRPRLISVTDNPLP